MNRKKYKNTYFYIFISLLLLIITMMTFFVVIYRDKKHESHAPKEKIIIQTDAKNSSPKTDEAKNKTVDLESIDYKKELIDKKIPIIMYHHIRDYDNPDDKIGTNLSVSPTKFAETLDYIKNSGYTTITFKDLITEKLPSKPIILTFDDGYQNFYDNAYPEIVKRDMKAVVFVITGFINKSGYMTQDQIKTAANKGIEIGDHTINHIDLSKASYDKAELEISNSKKTLESILETKIVSFCYPAGKYSADTENIVENAGLDFAVTTKNGITNFSDFYALNRYRANKDTNLNYYLK